VSETQTILCINSGSSSLKFRLYEMGAGEELLAKGAVEGIDQGEGRLWFVDSAGETFAERDLDDVGHEHAIEQALAALSDRDLPSVEAIGHRVVHGGPGHLAPELLTSELVDELHGLVAWAPLHLPASLRVIECLRRERPGIPQVACFDTAFHARMPEVARRFPMPRRFYDDGVQKYGFHGLSYEYILSVLGERAGCRLVMAHLGNGASLAACVGGRPLDTTMGMTPLGGFMMGTRTGDMDPGVLLYLLREHGYDVDGLEELLAKECGLKGVSGETADMETLLELRAAGHQEAAQAVEMYCYQIRKAIGSLAAVMGGLDLLVFAGGIGENATIVRGLICRGLEHLGIELDPARNNQGVGTISAEGATCAVCIVHTNEDLMIARHTYGVVFGSQSSQGGTS